MSSPAPQFKSMNSSVISLLYGLSHPYMTTGKTEGKRRRGQARIRWLDSITDSMDINLRKLWEIMEERGAWQAAIHGVSKSQT